MQRERHEATKGLLEHVFYEEILSTAWGKETAAAAAASSLKLKPNTSTPLPLPQPSTKNIVITKQKGHAVGLQYEGSKVVNVQNMSPADLGGIQQGDFISEVNGVVVPDDSEVVTKMIMAAPDSFDVKVFTGEVGVVLEQWSRKAVEPMGRRGSTLSMVKLERDELRDDLRYKREQVTGLRRELVDAKKGVGTEPAEELLRRMTGDGDLQAELPPDVDVEAVAEQLLQHNLSGVSPGEQFEILRVLANDSVARYLTRHSTVAPPMPEIESRWAAGEAAAQKLIKQNNWDNPPPRAAQPASVSEPSPPGAVGWVVDPPSAPPSTAVSDWADVGGQHLEWSRSQLRIKPSKT